MKNTILTPLRLAFIGIAILSAIGNLGVPFGFKLFEMSSLAGGTRFRNFGWNPWTVLAGFLNGLLIGEFVAVAFWILFDSVSLPKKLLLGTFLGCFLAACLIVGLQVWPGMPVAAGVFILVVGALLPIAFAGLVCCVARLCSPKVLRTKLAFESASRSQQFGVGFLLAVMFVVALAITMIRSVLPTGRSDWLSAYEFLFVGLWFGWLAIGTSLFIWFSFASVVQPTRVHIGTCIGLALLGPSLFQWISSFMLIGQMRIQTTPFFEALPQSISFGLLATSLLLGLVFRAIGNRKHMIQVTNEFQQVDRVEGHWEI